MVYGKNENSHRVAIALFHRNFGRVGERTALSAGLVLDKKTRGQAVRAPVVCRVATLGGACLSGRDLLVSKATNWTH